MPVFDGFLLRDALNDDGVPHPVSWTQVCHAAGLTDLAAFHFSLA